MDEYEEGRYAPVLTRDFATSRTMGAIWRSVFGDEHVESAESFGFVTRSELAVVREFLDLRAHQRFGDLGCGQGGPGRWLAADTRAVVWGADPVKGAVERCRARAAACEPPLSAGWRYDVGTFAANPFEDESLDAVLSIDALWMALDKPAAARGISRVLRPGGRCAITTWEPGYLDHRRLLDAAGLDVISRFEPDGWHERQEAVYARLLGAADELRDEIGSAAAKVLLREAEAAPAMLREAPRVFIGAVKR